MSPDQSRRDFMRYVPGAFFLLTAAKNTLALEPPVQNPNGNQGTGGQSGPTHPNSGGGTFGQGMGPGPSQKGGDIQPITIGRPHDKDPAPKKPRKDLAADQKSLRDEVRQLVHDTEELKKALEQFGPKPSLSAEMIDKTKEIEKLAHNIAELAKG